MQKPNIWKISHGTIGNPNGVRDDLKEPFKTRKIVVVYQNTKAKGSSLTSQGQDFMTQIKVGDFFYLCFGNKVQLLGKFKSENPKPNTDMGEGWFERDYKLIKESINSNSYSADDKWWSPNNNSTCIRVKEDELSQFEKLLLKPYFDMTLEDLMPVSTQLSMKNEKNIFLNTILYGPPGTGKTYITREKAVEICEPEFYKAHKDERDLIFTKYQELNKGLNEGGRVAFMTFHQSLCYEDFVEGIKPEVCSDDEERKNVIYNVQPGILKRMVDKATKADSGDYQDNFDEAFKKLLEKFTDSTIDKLGISLLSGSGKFEIELTKSGSGLKIVGHPRYFSKSQLYNIYKGLPGVPEGGHDNYRKAIVAEMKKTYGLLEYKKGTTQKFKADSYLLIIDEINRGNIAQIFGELITLIEESKRLGADDETHVTLPYSGDDFCLPPNLYILGTMNTADRSVEALDTALRRRFTFEEMMPKPELLSSDVEGVNLQELLAGLNNRIEYLLDRDHTIGHAYFMGVESLADLEKVFRNKIIPQLQEYFYSDWRKIQLILGEDIVKEESSEFNAIFGEKADLDNCDEEKKSYVIADSWNSNAYEKIYPKK